MRVTRLKRQSVVLAIAVIAIAGILIRSDSEWAAVPVTGTAQLVSVQTFPEGVACTWENPSTVPLYASLEPSLFVAAMQQQQQQGGGGRRAPLQAVTEITRKLEVRTIADTYPTYTAVGVNLLTDEVVLQDNNLWSTRVFNRLDNTPANARFTEPKRVIQGENTFIQFNNGVYIDPQNGDIYSVESDTGDKMVVFAHDAKGNTAPKRVLHTPHRVYSIAVDEEKKEIYVTVEYPPQIVVYRKEAADEEQPIRVIEGDRTLLKTPHGVALDTKNQLLFVNNWGMYTSYKNPGTGRFDKPAINIYPLNANGDVAPVRMIEGDKTHLNWPGNMTLHPETRELYVADDVDQSIVVFGNLTTANGNVGPVRVLKGDKTKLTYPTGVFVDTKHQELWVSNLGNSSATVYPLMANGNVAPLRQIRSAPLGHQSLTFGRTAAVAYDSKRQEILVPN
jgi:6-phosphogluconolactonase (cycloisomerase 2 family)